MREVGVAVLCHHGQQLGWLLVPERVLLQRRAGVHFALARHVDVDDGSWRPRPPTRNLAVTFYLDEWVTPPQRVLVLAELESDVDVSIEMVIPEYRRPCFRAGPVEQVLLADIPAFRPLSAQPRYL